jgi:hypothetical protein
LTRPYHKHPEDPLFAGHAFSAWVHRDGVAARGWNDLYWSPDGVHFVKAARMNLFSDGVYYPENFGNGKNPNGVRWGIASVLRGRGGTRNYYLVRFDCDLGR